MGSACEHWHHPPAAELTFMEAETCNQGLVNKKTCAFLNPTELNMYRYAAGSNTVILSYVKCNLFVTDSNRTSLLHTACRCGSLDVVQMLINYGLDVNLADIAGWSPMHIAVTYDRVDVMKALLRAGANPYIKNKQNNTVFYQIRHYEVRQLATTKIIEEEGVRYLIEIGDFRSIRDIYDRKTRLDDEVSFGYSLDSETQDVLNSRKSIWSVGSYSMKHTTTCPINNTKIYHILASHNPVWLSHLLNWKDYNTAEDIFSHIVSVDDHESWLLNYATSNVHAGWDILTLFIGSKVDREHALIDKIQNIFCNVAIPTKNFQLAMLAEVVSIVLGYKITNFIYCLLTKDPRTKYEAQLLGILESYVKKVVWQQKPTMTYDNAHLVRLDGQTGNLYTVDGVGVILSDRLSIISKTDRGDHECWYLKNGFQKRKENIKID